MSLSPHDTLFASSLPGIGYLAYLAVNSSKLSSLCASPLSLLTLVLKVLHPPNASAAVPEVDDTSGKRRKVCDGRKNGVDAERAATRSNAEDDIAIW